MSTLEEDQRRHSASHCIPVVTDRCCVSPLRQLEDRRQLKSSDDSHTVSARAGRGDRLQWGRGELGKGGRGEYVCACLHEEMERESEREEGEREGAVS